MEAPLTGGGEEARVDPTCLHHIVICAQLLMDIMLEALGLAFCLLGLLCASFLVPILADAHLACVQVPRC